MFESWGSGYGFGSFDPLPGSLRQAESGCPLLKKRHPEVDSIRS